MADYAVAAIRGYMAGGIIPVAKHFPGLGDTLADSHEVLPLAQSGDARRETDLLPFRRAVAAGVPMIMTAHLTVPEWDERPATLSPVALQHWLRQRLGFGGVIITDDLEMGGHQPPSCPRPRGPGKPWRQGPTCSSSAITGRPPERPPASWPRTPSLASRGREAAARLGSLRNTWRPRTEELKAVQEYFSAPG